MSCFVDPDQHRQRLREQIAFLRAERDAADDDRRAWYDERIRQLTRALERDATDVPRDTRC